MISEMLLRWPRPCSGRRHALFHQPALHRVRSRLVSERTAVINQIRGFLLERGIIVRQGLRFLRQALPDILAKRTDVLSPRMVRIIADLAGDWRQLDERIEPVTDEIETLAKSDSSCRRVMTVPGIGPIISSAMVAAIGSGAAFARGRDFSAWIGLVPKQMSTGDRTILGRISKRANGYLRTLFMQAARVILLRPASWPKHRFGVWLARPLSASIPTFWPPLSPTSWHGSPGRCWLKSAVMKRASPRRRPEADIQTNC